MNTPEVGPNAVTRLAEPLRQAVGLPQTRAIFARAGLESALVDPPRAMVSEQAVAALFAAVCAELPPEQSGQVLQQAGQATADYVIAHRIPRPVRWLLPRLPPALAARILLRAIARHAWTFSGSGRCRTQAGPPAIIEIEQNPLATPGCPWHRAVFLRMLQRLIGTDMRVEHGRCCAHGDGLCRFEIHRN